MRLEDKDEILSDPSIVETKQQLYDVGAPVDNIIDKAIKQATQNLSHSKTTAILGIYMFLREELAKWEDKREPKTFMGRLIKRIFGSN